MAGTTVGEIRARLVLDMADWSRRSQQARSDMDQMGRSSANLSKQMGLIQKASLAVGGAVVAGIGVSVKKAADFEEAMSRVKAISGATGQDFEDLKNIAAKMGAETKYTAVEAAEGLQYLAMAGFSVKAQVGSLPAVLNLAAASGEGLGRSADIVSNIMTGFGIKAEDSGHAVDVLVKAMTTANTDLPQLGDAMKFVAPVAHSLGYSIEDTATAVAKMSDAGIQGSMAGTALRASLLHLTNPVGQSAKAMKKYGIEVKDAHGNLKPIPELVGHISKQFEGMTSAQKTAAAAQLVGVEAASGFVTLLGVGEKGLRNYSKTLKDAVAECHFCGAFVPFQPCQSVFHADDICNVVQKRDTTFMDEYNPTESTGVPKYYANYDDDTLMFAPVPGSTYSILASYVAKPDGLSSSNTTTYVSQRFPNGLLYACLVEAFGYLKGPVDMLQYYDQRYKTAVAKYAIEQIGRRRRDDYFDGAIRIKIDSPSA